MLQLSGLGLHATRDFCKRMLWTCHSSACMQEVLQAVMWLRDCQSPCLYLSGLSSRERNLLKRKSRALQRSGSSQGSSKRSKSGNEATDAAVEQAEAEEDGQEWQAVAAGQWPFQAICDQMCIDMLDPVWEVCYLSHVVCNV